MKKGVSVLTALVVLTTVALPLCLGDEGEAVRVRPANEGDRKRPRKEGRDRGRREGFGEDVTFGEDLDKVDSLVTLKDDQRKKIEELKGKRDKALAKFDQTYERRIARVEAGLAKLRGRKDREAGQVRKQAEGFLKSVRTNRARRVDGYEKLMFAVLTPEQRAKWNTPILTEAMTKEFSLLFLEAKQEERIQTLCAAQAKRLSIPLNPEKHADALLGIKKLIFRTILTKQQRTEYLKLQAPKKKAGKGGEGRRRGRDR